MRQKYICYIRHIPFWRELPRLLLRLKVRPFLGGVRWRVLYALGFRIPAFGRLLRGRLSFPAGMGHNTALLRALLGEAHHLNRTAVLMRVNIHFDHNLGKPIINSVHDYYDLAHSYSTYKNQKKRLDYMEGKEFFQTVRGTKPLFVNHAQGITEQENRKYPIIVRQIVEIPSLNYDDIDIRAIQVNLKRNAALIRGGNHISSSLGNYYFLRWRAPWDKHQQYGDATTSRLLGWQEHLSQEERLRRYSIYQQFLSGELLSQHLPKIFPPGSKLYIASNVWPPYDRQYFNPLRNLYEVYRYYDFPALSSFVSGPKPNTAKLMLIEDQIKDSARRTLIVHPLNALELEKILELPSKK